MAITRSTILGIVLLASVALGQNTSSFAPLEQWQVAVLNHDARQLATLYSSSPPARINIGKGNNVDAAADVSFWTGLKIRSMNINIVQSATQTGIQQLLFQATAKTATGTLYIPTTQIWQMQNGVWRIVAASRDIAKLEQPMSINENIYPTGNAREEIREATARAAKTRKRVLVVFGADWCYDCHVLDRAFRRADIAAVLNPSYEVVHVDVGQGDKNQDLMNEYGVPMKRGIPAIAILDSGGKLLYSQKNGEWERARALGPEDLIAILKQWKAKG